jgi:4-amino-4-deoxy-L-arabinose transferase-like glycosyltransferase
MPSFPDRARAGRRPSVAGIGGVAAAIVAATLALLPGLGATPLVDWDEGIYAEVARGVHEGSAWRLVWNGEDYDRKPPLLFWAIAASYEVFGVSEAAARLPSALAGVATVGVVATVVAQRAGMLPGVLSAAFLLGSTLFLERGGRRACTDALLILFSTLALWRATSGSGTWRTRFEAGGAVGLAILSKGAAGLFAPLALLLAARDRERCRDAGALAAIGIAVALPWYAMQLWGGGSTFLASHVGVELIARAVRPIHGVGAPWSYPLRILLDTGGLWVAIVVLVALARGAVDRTVRDAMRPWLSAAAVVMVAAIAMRTKLPWYPLPALPMLAIAGGLAVAGGNGGRSWSRAAAVVVLTCTALNSVMLTGAARRAVLAGELEFEPFRQLGVRIASVLQDEPFIGSTQENPSLVFYGRRPVRVYQPDELSRLLLDPETLPHAGLLPEVDARALMAMGAEEIARFGDRILVRIVPSAPASFVEPVPPSDPGPTDT